MPKEPKTVVEEDSPMSNGLVEVAGVGRACDVKKNASSGELGSLESAAVE